MLRKKCRERRQENRGVGQVTLEGRAKRPRGRDRSIYIDVGQQGQVSDRHGFNDGHHGRGGLGFDNLGYQSR
jgi:hypothetical protein